MDAFKRYLPVLIALAAFPVVCSAAPTYSGSLTWSTGITAVGDWDDSGTTFIWQVWQNYQDSGLWFYKYTLTVAEDPEISHLISVLSGYKSNKDSWLWFCCSLKI